MKRSVPRLQGAAQRVAKDELVGRRVRIAAANDAGIVGLEGDVVGETLRTLELRVGGPGGRRIRVAKQGATFAFQEGEREVEVPGAAIEFRSWDRTKKVR